MSAAYYRHIGFFNPYLPLFTISVLTSVQAVTRLFAPYGWGVAVGHDGGAGEAFALQLGGGAGLLFGAAAHVYAHQFDDSNDRGCYGAHGERRRSFGYETLWTDSGMGLDWIFGDSVCGLLVV